LTFAIYNINEPIDLTLTTRLSSCSLFFSLSPSFIELNYNVPTNKGTGAFEGIEGSVTITTIAGTTGPISFFDDTDVTFVSGSKPVGSIVQVISVKSNMPLPPGP